MRSLIAATVAVLPLSACTSIPRLQPGIQPAYAAVNPSRMLAVTPVVFANPISRLTVEHAEVAAHKLDGLLEGLVLKSFQNQPGVNGVSFNSVRQSSATPPPSPVATLAEVIRGAAQERAEVTLKPGRLSPACKSARDLLEFYAYCLAIRADWLKGLNDLSSRVLNADTALLVFVTHLEKSQRSERPTSLAQLAVLVVDTNSGKLVWGREAESAHQGIPGGPFPPWASLFEGLLGETFWTQFPGRTQK